MIQNIRIFNSTIINTTFVYSICSHWQLVIFTETRTDNNYLEVKGLTILAKMCLLGDGNVGKTSLRNQYMGKGFQSDYLPTLGADFASIEVQIPFPAGEKSLRWQIWDLAGQPSFSQIRNFYYKHSKAALLIFDLRRINRNLFSSKKKSLPKIWR